MKIMLADDEANIRTLVERIITDDGHSFCSAQDGAEALEVFNRELPDLLILDVMMPKINGFDVCAELRRQEIMVPILFLSAKGDIVDKSIGFKAGGDDYLVKPFSSQELSLRVEALLRRRKQESQFGNWLEKKDVVKVGELEVLFKKYEVRVQGKKIELTPKEFQIVALLASAPGEVFTREQLMECVWGDDYIGESAGITVFIRRIREKIEADPSHPQYVQTVWRVGYRLGS